MDLSSRSQVAGMDSDGPGGKSTRFLEPLYCDIEFWIAAQGQESNKVFEVKTLALDAFSVPSNTEGVTGKVTCSVPFSEPLAIHYTCPIFLTIRPWRIDAPDGRQLVSIGCSEGVWIWFTDGWSRKFIFQSQQI